VLITNKFLILSNSLLTKRYLRFTLTMNYFAKAFNNLTDLGVTDTLKVEEIQRVKLTNILGFTPMIMYSIYLIFGLVTQYYFPVILCSILLIITFVGLVLNKKKHYGLAKFILFGVNSLSVFVAYNCLNIDYSICCYFFPLFMAYEILYDLKTEKKRFLPSVFFMCCVLLCVTKGLGLFF
jgi:hypothetical protein